MGVTKSHGCMQKFFQGGKIWGTDKGEGGGGGGEAYVECYTLHLLGGGENDTRGGKYPSPPPLNTALNPSPQLQNPHYIDDYVIFQLKVERDRVDNHGLSIALGTMSLLCKGNRVLRKYLKTQVRQHETCHRECYVCM